MPDFIIVGSDGTEHHFPEGMDVQKAVQTVRNVELTAANAKPISEPTDYWGGVRKGADDFATGLGRAGFESMAHPQTAGDFLSLLMPSMMGASRIRGLKSVSEAEPIGNRVVRGAARLGADALDLTPNVLSSKTEQKVITGLRKVGEAPPPRWVDRYKPNKSSIPDRGVDVGELPQSTASMVDPYMPNKGGIPDRGIPTGEMPQSTASMVDPHMPNTGGIPDRGIPQEHPLPTSSTSEVDRYMPNTGGVPDSGVSFGDLPAGNHVEVESPLDYLRRKSETPSGSPTQTDRVPYATPTESATAPTARVAGKAPTLEEVLQQTLEEVRTAKDPILKSTAASPVETAGGGPFKQSWPKSKQQNLGGHSSGRPPAVENTPVSEAVTTTAEGKGASTVGTDNADVTVTSAAAPNKPHLSVADTAAELRRHYGSRDAGTMLYGNSMSAAERAAAVKRLAPGPSRTPIVAENRINAAPRDLSLEEALREIIINRGGKPE